MAFQPDLILMDVQLPGMDGVELTQRPKADPQTRGSVIAAFTSHDLRGDGARMLGAGCDGHIAKPIDATMIATHVRALLRAHDGARPAAAAGCGEPPTAAQTIEATPPPAGLNRLAS